MKKLINLFIVLLACVASACSNDNTDEPRTEGEPRAQRISLSQTDLQLLNSTAAFSSNLIAKCCSEAAQDQNVAVSPLSAAVNLALLANVASGQVYKDITDCLDLKDYDVAQLNETYRKLLGGLPLVDPATDVRIGSSVWSSARYMNVMESVRSPLEDNYGTYFGVFEDKESPQQLYDAWIADATGGKIAQAPRFQPGTSIVMLNFILFNGQWTTPFDEKLTHDAAFTTNSGQIVTTPMMYNPELPAKAFLDDRSGSTILMMPYGQQDAFVMYVIQPDARVDIRDFAASFNWASIHDAIAHAAQQNKKYNRLAITIPKFKVVSELNLNGVLTKMGLANIFGPIGNPIAPELAVDYICQQTVIEVNEKGTESSAATIAGLQDIALTDISVEVKIDRPFMFIVAERDSGVVLSGGIVSDPSKP